MTSPLRLSPDDRALFSLVTEASLANPFGERRLELDAEMAKGRGTEQPLPAALARVAERVSRLEADGRARASLYQASDRELVFFTLLFDAFHRYAAAFDQHAAEQRKAGDDPVPLAFAAEALALLVRRGFGAEEARRLLALFYQLRRAFFFIDRSLVGRCRSTRALRERLWRNLFSDDLRSYTRYLWNRMEDSRRCCSARRARARAPRPPRWAAGSSRSTSAAAPSSSASRAASWRSTCRSIRSR
jgi:hypothetical protein